MDYKKLNITLVITVIVLLAVAALAFLKVLLSNSKAFEWGSVTDWISAACNIAMAGAAVYAAVNAQNWISPKIQHEGFKQASICMAEMIQLRILQQHLLASYRLIIKPENNVTSNDLLDNFKRHNELWQEFSKKVIDYGTRCEGLKIWKIYVLQTDKFHTLISHLSKTNKIHSKLISSFNMDDGIYIVLQKWQKHNSDIEEVHKSLADSIRSLTVDFDTLFK